MVPTLIKECIAGMAYFVTVNQKLLEQEVYDITVYKLINFSVIYLSAL